MHVYTRSGAVGPAVAVCNSAPILSQYWASATKDVGFWAGKLIYWTLTSPNYNSI
jgi:hypothetical protein